MKYAVIIVILIVALFTLALTNSLGVQVTDSIYWDSFYGVATKLLSGTLISFLFYFLLVALPARKKRAVIKKSVLSKYTSIRRNILQEFIFVSIDGGRNDLDRSFDTLERLMKPVEFKKEFTGYIPNGGIGPFRNQIDDDLPAYKRIIFELKLLQKEVDYIAHNYEISDLEVFEKLRRLEDVILELEFIGPGYVEEKALTSFLYEMFTGFSFISGGLVRDPVHELLSKL